MGQGWRPRWLSSSSKLSAACRWVLRARMLAADTSTMTGLGQLRVHAALGDTASHLLDERALAHAGLAREQRMLAASSQQPQHLRHGGVHAMRGRKLPVARERGEIAVDESLVVLALPRRHVEPPLDGAL